MSISKKMTMTLASLLTAATLCHLGAAPNMPAPLNGVTIQVPATLEDLKNAALAFEAADNAFNSHPAGQLVLNYRNIFKTRVLNSSKDHEKVVKAVKKAMEEPSKCGLKHRFAKKEAPKQMVKEAKEFAQAEVLSKLEGFLKKIENKEPSAEASFESKWALMKATRDYYVSLMKVDRNLFEQRSQASHACKHVALSLMKQGVSLETVKKTIRDAGVKNPLLFGKINHWATKA